MIFQGGAPEAPSQPNPTPNRSDNAKPAPAPTPEQPPAPDAPPATSSPPPEASPAPTPQVTTPPPEEAQQAEASPPLQTQPPPPQAQAAPEQPPPSAPEPARQSEALLQPQAPPPSLEPQPEPPPPPPPPNVPPRVELHLPRPPVEPPSLEVPEPLPPPSPRPAPQRPRPQPRNEFTPTFRQWALGRPPPPQTGGFGPPVQGPSREAPQIRGAERLGADWANELSAWVEAHKYYPQQAILNGEDGSPEVDVTVRRDGTVLAVDLDARSGSQWLDLALQALFRGAHLPPFPDGAGTQQLTFHFTMHYILVRR